MDDEALEEGIGLEPNTLRRRRVSKPRRPLAGLPSLGGSGESRTLKALSGSPVFETSAITSWLALPRRGPEGNRTLLARWTVGQPHQMHPEPWCPQ